MKLWNHFQAEILIQDRLKNKVACVPKNKILSGLSQADIIKNHKVDKAIYVLYHDDNISSDRSGDGIAQQVEQLWLVVVAVRNVSNPTGQSAREDAGEIVDAVLKSLQGFDMYDRFSSLHREKCPFKNSYIKGVMYFPMMFSTQITTIGIGND